MGGSPGSAGRPGGGTGSGRRSRYRSGRRRRAARRVRGLFMAFLLAGLGAAGWFLFPEEREEILQSFRPVPVSTEQGYSTALCVSHPESIPDYAGEPSVELNGNIPSFTEYDLEQITGERYSDLDPLGRCGSAAAMLDESMMPSEERGEIGEVRPSGWRQKKYPGIIDSDPPFLYNRCHLIAFALTGQNANEKNLITGTRYMNFIAMLPYEQRVMRFLDSSGDHVLYRVTPYFRGAELLARGVELEAYSVEDSGRGVCFHVFAYNVQPGIGIDYRTGESWEGREQEKHGERRV